jgi:hypothetical protein
VTRDCSGRKRGLEHLAQPGMARGVRRQDLITGDGRYVILPDTCLDRFWDGCHICIGGIGEEDGIAQYLADVGVTRDAPHAVLGHLEDRGVSPEIGDVWVGICRDLWVERIKRRSHMGTAS